MAIQSLKQAGVPLSDCDGVTISAEDIATGDKELILSLLWNTFMHLQIPLLANKTSLARELARLQVPLMEQFMPGNKSQFCLLYNWAQAVCSKYGMNLQSTSQVDRSALSCIVNYYLNTHVFLLKETRSGCQKELFTSHELDTVTDLTSCPYNKMGKVLADFLQDIPASGILADDASFDERSAIIFLAFLYSHVTNEKRLGQLKNLISTRFHYQSPEIKISTRCMSRGKNDMKYQSPQTEREDSSCTNQDWAATIIQTQARCMIAKNKYCNHRKSIFILQGAMRAWSAVIMKRNSSCVTTASTHWQANGRDNRYFVFIIERHRFVQMKKCAITIQRALRIWIEGRKSHKNNKPFESHESSETTTPAPLEQFSEDNKAIALASPVQRYEPVQHEDTISTRTDFSVCKEVVAAQRIQSAWRRRSLLNTNVRVTAATKIQRHWRGLLVRKSFTRKVQAILAIQSSTRRFLYHPAFKQHQLAARLIQRVVRGWLARKRMLGSSSLQTYTRLCVLDQSQHKKCHQSLELKIVLNSVLSLQRCWRKLLLCQSTQTSVISMQSFVRGWLARKQLVRIRCCINIIQRWWRKVLFLETRKRSVIVIQAHLRGWIARLAAVRKRRCITTIQSYFKAYHVRKVSKQEVAHIRSRLQKSFAQVDDGMRLINRLLAALSQLALHRSLSSIRQTYETLCTATKYSKKCCETLVTDGAVDILLKQIPVLNSGIADQEVLKLVLLTLRNIARYPNLRTVLLNTPESVKIIFQELLRNKADGFFIASDILKKLCESKEGKETTRALQDHVKMLRSLLYNLEKKVELDKRNGRTGAVRETNLKRHGEAATLYYALTEM